AARPRAACYRGGRTHGQEKDVCLLCQSRARAGIPRGPRVCCAARGHRLVSGARVRAPRMSRVGIIAALPGELKPLVQGWKPVPLPGARKGQAAWSSRVDGVDCIAVCAGVGSEAAAHACELSAQGGALDAIVSVGWSGALSCGIHPGNAYPVNEVVDALTGEHFATNFRLPEETGVPLRLVTTDHIVQY